MMKSILTGILAICVLSLSAVLCHGSTDVAVSNAKPEIGVVTNDAHIKKMDDSGLSLVYEVPLAKKQIYDRLVTWMILNYNDYSIVIENKDFDNGQIIGKGRVEFPYFLNTYRCEYIIIVDIKENKYRVQYNHYICDTGSSRRQFSLPFEKSSLIEVQQKLILQSKTMFEALTANQDNKDF